jgi:hypothetical protein
MKSRNSRHSRDQLESTGAANAAAHGMSRGREKRRDLI